MAIQTVNPTTGKVVKKFAPMSQTQIDRKLDLARKAFEEWKEYSYVRRGALLKQVAADLRKNKRKYAELITLEMGKPITQAVAEVDKCAVVCDFYAQQAEKFLSPDQVPTENNKSYVRYDPLGLLLAIMPWNFPFWQVFRAAAPALMAGNGVVLKHASNVPQTALLIEKIFAKYDFPKGIFSTLLVEGKDTEKLVADPRIAAVTLTGSEQAGREVGKAAGYHLKKTVLELGGSDPFIVLADVDIDAAAKVGVQARVLNAGQSCICAKRFIVEKSVADRFLTKFKRYMSEVVVGDPLDEKTQVGPMVSEKALLTLQKQLDQSKQGGAQVEVGGMRMKGPGCFFEPTIIRHINKKNIAYTDEFFGPVAIVIIVKDANEAVKVANDTTFGLGASIWTKNIKEAEKLAARIESGCVFINDLVKSDPRLPFGGIKNSGYGRELGSYGIKEFVNIKTVVVK